MERIKRSSPSYCDPAAENQAGNHKRGKMAKGYGTE
jgi:hypothetical protein